MKIANKFILVFTTLLLFSCNRKLDSIKKECFNSFNPDSVYYHIDVKWDKEDENEVFLVTRSILVSDSIIGGYSNYENRHKAWAYLKANFPNKDNYNLLYKFYYFDKNIYKEFASLIFDENRTDYPILRQGSFSNLDIVSKKKIEQETTSFIRIMEVNDFNLNSRSINIMFKNNNWEIISKEIISTNNKSNYCLDTIQNNFPLKNIRFDEIFYHYSSFNCKN